ncbi:hypothetical protein [Saccharopolyspora kobensis]|nr:hypothetical protein [Saccharopolyspora kobensis]
MSEAATAASQKRGQQLAQQQAGLDIQGTDPASIAQRDNWNDWDHARLYNQLGQSLQPQEINESGQAWIALGEEFAEVFADLESDSRRIAGDRLQGEAAEAGLNAAKPLQDWGQQLGDAVRGTGLKIQEAGNAAGQTKATLEPPKEFDGLRNGFRTVISPGGGMIDGAQQLMEQREATQQARQLVQNVYASGYESVDSSTPTFPPPVDPLNPPPPPDQGRSNQQAISSTPSGISGQPSGSVPGGGGVPGGGSIPGGGGLPGGGYTPPAQSSSQWAGQPNLPGPGLGAPPPGSTPPGGGGGGFLGAMPPGGGPGGPGGRGPGGLGAGGRGPGGAGGMGAGGRAGAGGPGMGAGGRAGMGGLGTGAGAGGVGGAAAGGAGARGGAGGGMGAGAGQRGQGSEDQEHDRPSWLEEQDDIWLDDMPRTAPPVFGDWGN